jgi:AcrR family transcriptional regulator
LQQLFEIVDLAEHRQKGTAHSCKSKRVCSAVMKMQKKQIKRNRIINYFIEAAVEIIEQEGIEGITIRKIADKAGYNSATIYNYFENLDHLIFLAALKFINPYTKNVGDHIKGAANALEKNLLIWEYFCTHSFTNPPIYSALFFPKFRDPERNYTAEYYDLNPNDLSKNDVAVTAMLSKNTIYERSLIILEDCVNEGFFKASDINDINEMCMLIYKGMLTRALDNEMNCPIEEFVQRTMKYIKVCYKGFLIDPNAINP